MSPSTSGQAGPAPSPEADAAPRDHSTSRQRLALAARLRGHVAALEGVRHPTAAPERHRAARDYVATALRALGLPVELVPFTFRGRTHHNVVATLSGRDARRPRLLVGAHYDSTPDTPGAQIVPPFLGIDVPRTGDFLAAVGDTRSRALLDGFVAAARAAVPELPIVPYRTRLRGWLLPLTRLSDNASFWDARYPSLMLTDTAFLRNPHYHQTSDTSATLDFEFMAQVTEATAAAVTRLAGA